MPDAGAGTRVAAGGSADNVLRVPDVVVGPRLPGGAGRASPCRAGSLCRRLYVGGIITSRRQRHLRHRQCRCHRLPHQQKLQLYSHSSLRRAVQHWRRQLQARPAALARRTLMKPQIQHQARGSSHRHRCSISCTKSCSCHHPIHKPGAPAASRGDAANGGSAAAVCDNPACGCTAAYATVSTAAASTVCKCSRTSGATSSGARWRSPRRRNRNGWR